MEEFIQEAEEYYREVYAECLSVEDTYLEDAEVCYAENVCSLPL